MHFIPYCSMRSTPEAEALGMDEYDMGEFAYDYVRPFPPPPSSN